MATNYELALLAWDATQAKSNAKAIWNRRIPVSIPNDCLEFMIVTYTHNLYNEIVIVYVTDIELAEVAKNALRSNFGDVTFGLTGAYVQSAIRQASHIKERSGLKITVVGFGVGGVLAQFVAGNCVGTEGVTFNSPSPMLSSQSGQYSWLNESRLGHIWIEGDKLPGLFGESRGNRPMTIRPNFSKSFVGSVAVSILDDTFSPFSSWGKSAADALRSPSVPAAVLSVAESLATDKLKEDVKKVAIDWVLAAEMHALTTVVSSLEGTVIGNAQPNNIMRGWR